MYKWLARVLAVAIIGLLAAHIVLDQAGIPLAEQRPVTIPLMAGAVLSVALCIGRFLTKGSPVPGRPEADPDRPA